VGRPPDPALQTSRRGVAIKNDFSRLNSNLMVAAGRLTIFKRKETRAAKSARLKRMVVESKEAPHGI
jgi:hypothetical protein